MSADPFIDTLLATHLRVALLVGLVYAALTLFDRRASAERHAVWLTAIAGCLAFPWVGAVLPALPVPILPSAETFAPVAGSPAAGGGAVAVDAAPAIVGRGFAYAYLAGAAVVLTGFAVSILRIAISERSMTTWQQPETLGLKDALCRELRIGRDVRLLESRGASSPFTWGVFRPRIALPAAARDWPRERMRNALLHELCHVERLDWLRLCLLRLAACIYWPNPLVWIAVRECDYEAERACDDFVLRCGGRSSDYAEQLVDLMASSRAGGTVGMALGDTVFSRRIRAILSSSQEVRVMSKLRTRIAAALTASAVVALAACQVTSGQPIPAERGDETALEREEALQREAALEREAIGEAEVAREREAVALEREEAAEREAILEREAAREREIALEREALEAQEARELEQASREQAALEQVARAEREAVRRAEIAQRSAQLEVERAQRQRVIAEEQRLSGLAEEIARRTALLHETEARMQAQAREIEELRMAFERQNEAIAQRDRAIADLESELEALRSE